MNIQRKENFANSCSSPQFYHPYDNWNYLRKKEAMASEPPNPPGLLAPYHVSLRCTLSSFASVHAHVKRRWKHLLLFVKLWVRWRERDCSNSQHQSYFFFSFSVLPKGFSLTKPSPVWAVSFGAAWDIDHHTHGWKAWDKSQIRGEQFENSDWCFIQSNIQISIKQPSIWLEMEGSVIEAKL